tara:strand:+ start:97 stop:339 length:243 start_codon:yes stop_codon:yes gene_type:complete
MSNLEEGEYKIAGLNGVDNIFDHWNCMTIRTWRRQLLLLPDRYRNTTDEEFDECNNAFFKPKPVRASDMLENLHKMSDYE